MFLKQSRNRHSQKSVPRRGLYRLASRRRPHFECLERRNLLTAGMDAADAELLAFTSWETEALTYDDFGAVEEIAVALLAWDGGTEDRSAWKDEGLVAVTAFGEEGWAESDDDAPMLLQFSFADAEVEVEPWFAFAERESVLAWEAIEADVWSVDGDLPVRTFLAADVDAHDDETFVTFTAFGGEDWDARLDEMFVTFTTFDGEDWDARDEEMFVTVTAFDGEDWDIRDDETFVTVTAFDGEDWDAVLDTDETLLHRTLTVDDADPLDTDAFAEIMLLSAVGPSPWQNLDNPVDVNGDGWTTPLDALLVINRVNEGVTLSALAATPMSVFADVNGDRRLDSRDALQVINDLNGGDGAEVLESDAASHAAPLWYDGSLEDPAPALEHASRERTDDDGGDLEADAADQALTVPRPVQRYEEGGAGNEDPEKPQAKDDESLFSEDADWLLPDLL